MQRLPRTRRGFTASMSISRATKSSPGLVDLIKINGVWPCYIRPIILRGYGEAGVNPFQFRPPRSTFVNYPWGKYLGTDSAQGVGRLAFLRGTRIAPEYAACNGKVRRELHELTTHQDGSDY